MITKILLIQKYISLFKQQAHEIQPLTLTKIYIYNEELFSIILLFIFLKPKQNHHKSLFCKQPQTPHFSKRSGTNLFCEEFLLS